MAINLTSVKCPDCGAQLPIEEGRTQLFCSYCGAKIIMTNENEYIYHHVNDAEMKKAETERIVKMKKLELSEKAREAQEKKNKVKMIISIILGAFIIICFAVGYAGDAFGMIMPGMVGCIIIMWMNKDKEEEDDSDYGDKVRIPSSVIDFEDKNYASIEAMFRSAGFTNIKCVPLCDLTMGLFKKPGSVDSITVKGEEITSGGKKVSPDVPVVISYHSLSR